MRKVKIYPLFLSKKGFHYKPHSRNKAQNFYKSDGSFNNKHAMIKDDKYIHTNNNLKALNNRKPILKVGDKLKISQILTLKKYNISYEIVRV